MREKKQKEPAYSFSEIIEKSSHMPHYNPLDLSALDDGALNDITRHMPMNVLMLPYYLEQLHYIEQSAPPQDPEIGMSTDEYEGIQNHPYYVLKNNSLSYQKPNQKPIFITNDVNQVKKIKEILEENVSYDLNKLNKDQQKKIVSITGHNPIEHQSIITQLRTTLLLLGQAAIYEAKLGKPIQHRLDHIERCYKQILKWSPLEERMIEEEGITQHIDYLAYLMGYQLEDIKTALSTKEMVFKQILDFKGKAVTFKTIKHVLESKNGFINVNYELYYADFHKGSLIKIDSSQEEASYVAVQTACQKNPQNISPVLAHHISKVLAQNTQLLKNIKDYAKKSLKKLDAPRTFFTQTYLVLSPLIKLLSMCLAYAKRVQKIANDANKKSESDMVNLIIAMVLLPLRLALFFYAVVDTRKSSKLSLKERFSKAFEVHGRDLWSGLFAATINCMTYFWLTGTSGNLGLIGKITSISVFAGVDIIASLFAGIRSKKRYHHLVSGMKNNIANITATEDINLDMLLTTSDHLLDSTIDSLFKKETLDKEELELKKKQIWAVLYVMRKAHAEYAHERNAVIIKTLQGLLSATSSAMITFTVFPIFAGPIIALFTSIVINIASSINDIHKTSKMIQTLDLEYDKNQLEKSNLISQSQDLYRFKLILNNTAAIEKIDEHPDKPCYFFDGDTFYFQGINDKKAQKINPKNENESKRLAQLFLEDKTEIYLSSEQARQLMTFLSARHINEDQMKHDLAKLTPRIQICEKKETELQNKIAYHKALRDYQKITAITNTLFDAAVSVGMCITFTFLPFGVIPIVIALGIMITATLVKMIGEKVIKNKIIESRKGTHYGHYSMFHHNNQKEQNQDEQLELKEDNNLQLN